MGVSYIIMPVDERLINWGKECGMPVPQSLSASRLPTLNEVRLAVQSLVGYIFKERPQPDSKDIDIDIDSIETKEFTSEQNPILEKIYGSKVFTCPVSSTTLWIKISEDDQITNIFFHKGDPKLAILVMQKFTTYCGPLALIADCDGNPLFITSDKEPPEGLDRW
jgi:hypothetical protein